MAPSDGDSSSIFGDFSSEERRLDVAGSVWILENSSTDARSTSVEDLALSLRVSGNAGQERVQVTYVCIKVLGSSQLAMCWKILYVRTWAMSAARGAKGPARGVVRLWAIEQEALSQRGGRTITARFETRGYEVELRRHGWNGPALPYQCA